MLFVVVYSDSRMGVETLCRWRSSGLVKIGRIAIDSFVAMLLCGFMKNLSCGCDFSSQTFSFTSWKRTKIGSNEELDRLITRTSQQILASPFFFLSQNTITSSIDRLPWQEWEDINSSDTDDYYIYSSIPFHGFESSPEFFYHDNRCQDCVPNPQHNRFETILLVGTIGCQQVDPEAGHDRIGLLCLLFEESSRKEWKTAKGAGQLYRKCLYGPGGCPNCVSGIRWPLSNGERWKAIKEIENNR